MEKSVYNRYHEIRPYSVLIMDAMISTKHALHLLYMAVNAHIFSGQKGYISSATFSDNRNNYCFSRNNLFGIYYAHVYSCTHAYLSFFFAFMNNITIRISRWR